MVPSVQPQMESGLRRSLAIFAAVLFALGALAVVPQPASALIGGPDGANYRFTDSSEPGGPAYVWDDVSATGATSSCGFFSCDDGLGGTGSSPCSTGTAIPIGFTYTWYGLPSTSVCWGTNGFLCIQPSTCLTSACCSGVALPSTSFSANKNIVVAYWTDLYCLSCQVHYKTLGTAPLRMFVLQVDNEASYCCSGSSSWEYKLYESSNWAEVHYKTLSDPFFHCYSVGIQGSGAATPAPGLGLTYKSGCGGSPVWTSKAIRYYGFTFPLPKVNFSTPFFICKGTTVAFTNLSTSEIGPPGTLSWDFGDNPPAFSTATSPTHEYAVGPADYTVKLTESWPAPYGYTTTTTHVVHVNGCILPVCDFDTQVMADGVVKLQDKSSDPDGAVVKWSWDFGDRSLYSGKTPVQHAYSFGGNFGIALTVTDNEGSSVTCKTVVKVPGQAPDNSIEPKADAGPDQKVTEGSVVHLDGSGGDANRAVTFNWRQISGPIVTFTGADDERPMFTPAPLSGRQPQVYGFSLTIYDGKYTSKPDVVIITVMPPAIPPVANAGVDQVVLQSSLVSLDGTASHADDGGILTYAWTQVSGPAVNLVAADTVSPIFAAPGNLSAPLQYAFQLVVSTPDATSQPSLVGVTVNPIGASGIDGFRFEKAYDIQQGMVSFQAQVPDGANLTYQWDFGDGTAARDGGQVTHVFPKTGSYTVTLKASGGQVPQLFQRNVAVYLTPEDASRPLETQQSPAPAALLVGLLLLGATVLQRRKK